jgi:7-keto-8-aminopelargonate synthetase-like enzyme
VIDHLRQHSLTGNFEGSLPPVCCQQVISVLKVLMGKEGTDLGAQRLKTLRENSNFFRRALIDRGFYVCVIIYCMCVLYQTMNEWTVMSNNWMDMCYPFDFI